MEVTKWLKPSISVSRIGGSASVQAATRVNAEQALYGAFSVNADFQTHQASRRDQIPIALAAPPSHVPPRFRALALFGRRPHQYATRPSTPASENLHSKRHWTSR